MRSEKYGTCVGRGPQCPRWWRFPAQCWAALSACYYLNESISIKSTKILADNQFYKSNNISIQKNGLLIAVKCPNLNLMKTLRQVLMKGFDNFMWFKVIYSDLKFSNLEKKFILSGGSLKNKVFRSSILGFGGQICLLGLVSPSHYLYMFLITFWKVISKIKIS